MRVRILRPGLLTTIQDTGRLGYRKEGIIVSGAMDLFALRAANLLAGNDEGAAAIEATLMGPAILFETEALISVCGGDLSPSINGKGVPLWRPVYVQAGQTLEFGACRSGARAYVALAGGIDVPEAMRSRSTYLRAGIGGFEGRVLQGEDRLESGALSDSAAACMKRFASSAGSRAFRAAEWFIGRRELPCYARNPVIRVVRGREFEWFTEESRGRFFTAAFRVTPQSDRMGYRLEGEKVKPAGTREAISAAVAFGTVQVPPEGNPIILMADCQTVGGYPKIAQVVSVDLPVLAQVKPGESVRFKEISLQEAENLYLDRELNIRRLAKAIHLRLNEKR